MSIKIEMMVKDIKDNNKDYKKMHKNTIKSYLKIRYKCSAYLAKKVVEILFAES
jgi:hypothetical protein